MLTKKQVWSVVSSNESHVEDKDRYERAKIRVVSGVGLLLPFLASIPPLGAWGALMTVPFIMYLVLMVGNIGSTIVYPADILNISAILVGIVLLFYSVNYLWKKKAEGLVTTGPYRIVRHPQYFSIIIFTTVITYQSIWVLQHTFGIGWLSTDQTMALWIAMLVAYVLIATVEELHLERRFGTDWIEYRGRVGFLIPFIRFRSRIAEAILCLILPIAFLYGMLYVTT
jgi:protein-S-isoprenylcysteine O-methyltransferase Ste14